VKSEDQHVTIRLICTDFPGRTFDGKAGIRVGIQKGNAVIDDVAGDAVQATFDCEMRVKRHPDTGKPNFLGPFAHGKPAERFLYLCWGQWIGNSWHGFRRAKIHLRDLDWKTVQVAVGADRPIEAVVSLTDSKGEPLCASVKADKITWRL
jgi:hypothetical protein